ncbi:hypothetical protein ABK040_003905 [Willaertia magna]
MVKDINNEQLWRDFLLKPAKIDLSTKHKQLESPLLLLTTTTTVEDNNNIGSLEIRNDLSESISNVNNNEEISFNNKKQQNNKSDKKKNKINKVKKKKQTKEKTIDNNNEMVNNNEEKKRKHKHSNKNNYNKKKKEQQIIEQQPKITKPKDLCKFYLTGSCYKGENCPFSHDKSSFPCKFFHLYNSCTKGNLCEYSHALPLSQEYKELLENNEKKITIDNNNLKNQKVGSTTTQIISLDEINLPSIPFVVDNNNSMITTSDVKKETSSSYYNPDFTTNPIALTMPMPGITSSTIPPTNFFLSSLSSSNMINHVDQQQQQQQNNKESNPFANTEGILPFQIKK